MRKIYFLGKEYIGFALQSINNVLLDGNKTSEQIGVVDMVNPKLDLSDYQTAGSVDKELYDAIVALGWDTDVLEQ